mgnify:CR=1 FL=1
MVMKYEKKRATTEEDIELRETIRKRLNELRTSHNMTQAEFGEIFGKSKTGVASWESGNSLPDIQTLYKIATFFDKSLAYMYGDNGTDYLVSQLEREDTPSILVEKENSKLGMSQMYVTDGERKLIEELRERGSNIDAKTLEEMFNTILRYHQENNPIDTDKPQYYEIRLKHYFED